MSILHFKCNRFYTSIVKICLIIILQVKKRKMFLKPHRYIIILYKHEFLFRFFLPFFCFLFSMILFQFKIKQLITVIESLNALHRNAHGHGFGQILFFFFYFYCLQCFRSAFHVINQHLRFIRRVINKVKNKVQNL